MKKRRSATPSFRARGQWLQTLERGTLRHVQLLESTKLTRKRRLRPPSPPLCHPRHPRLQLLLADRLLWTATSAQLVNIKICLSFIRRRRGTGCSVSTVPTLTRFGIVPTAARNSVTTRPNAITILATNKLYYTFVILSCTIKYTGYGDDYSNSSRRIMEAQILEISSSLEKLERQWRLEYLFPD